MLLTRRMIVPIAATAVLGLGAVKFLFVGRDFFPAIDGGQIQLHVRVPAGTRIEKTEQIFEAMENKIREIIPVNERELIVDNIGLPTRLYNLAFADGPTIGVDDGVILVSLKDGHRPTAYYVRKLRQELSAAFPEDTFYFQPADMVTPILNFGLTAQLDVRTVGYDRVKNLQIARKVRRRISAVLGIVDAHLQQEVDGPEFFAAIDRRQDRRRAAEATLARQYDPGIGPDPKHEQRLSRYEHRSLVRCRFRLPADGRELPESWRPVRRHPGVARDLLRNCHDALRHRHDPERSIAELRLRSMAKK